MTCKFVFFVLDLCTLVSLWNPQTTYEARRCVFKSQHHSCIRSSQCPFSSESMLPYLDKESAFLPFAMQLPIWNSGIINLHGWDPPCSCFLKNMLTLHGEATLSTLIIRSIATRLELKCGTQVSTSVMFQVMAKTFYSMYYCLHEKLICAIICLCGSCSFF